jgi:hypothetical protein
MIPWNKLPGDLQKAILAMVIVFGGTSTACRLAPPICDPAPPPPTTPRTPSAQPPTGTPMICDPAPPPVTARPPTGTPMICDPAPPPSITPSLKATATATPTTPATPTPPPIICDPAPPPPLTGTPMICDPPPPPPPATVAPGQHFTPRRVQIASDGSAPGVNIRASIVDQAGQPVSGLKVLVEHAGEEVPLYSGRGGAFFANFPEAGTYILSIEGAESSRLTLELKLHDVATVEWVESRDQSQLPLPLAEIRAVAIVRQAGLSFAAQTPWPDARHRWSVSGGTLAEAAGSVTWQPPVEPGRYLLQVVADWGRTGLAVDAVVLVVEEDGRVTWRG